MCVCMHVVGRGAEVEDSEEPKWARPTSVTYRLGDFRLCHITSESAFSSIKQETKTLY